MRELIHGLENLIVKEGEITREMTRELIERMDGRLQTLLDKIDQRSEERHREVIALLTKSK